MTSPSRRPLLPGTLGALLLAIAPSAAPHAAVPDAGPSPACPPHHPHLELIPDGCIGFVASDPDQVRPDVVFLAPDQYADGDGHAPDPRHPERGFFDRVVADRIERFGDMAHVRGACASHYPPADHDPFVRGIKSMDLLHRDGHRYILQACFARERPGVAVPPACLRGTGA